MLTIACYAFIGIFGLLCNSFVLIAILKYKALRKKQYVFLVSLVICDLLKVVVIVSIIITTLSGNAVFLREKTSIMGATLLFSSTFHLAAESINRLCIIYSPYTYLQTLRKPLITMIIVMLWLIPIVVIIVLPLFLFGTNCHLYMFFGIELLCCSQSLDEDGLYVLVVNIIFLGAPLVIMLVSYSCMLKTSCRNAQNIRLLSQPVPTTPIVGKTTYSQPIMRMIIDCYDTMFPTSTIHYPKARDGHRVFSIASVEFKRVMKVRHLEIKAAKTILIIIMTFIVCNIPMFVLTWYDQIKCDNSMKIAREAFVVITMCQVCINPVIYMMRLKDFKRARRTFVYYFPLAIQKVFLSNI